MRPWGKSSVAVRRAELADCDELSEMHASGFSRGWSNAEFESILAQPGTHAFVAHYRGAFGTLIPAGFILYRLAADEAEILSVAVVPGCRRRGVGRMLIEEVLRHAYRAGTASVHLEVEDTNQAAIALYRRQEFRETGRRAGYYTQGRASPGGALVMLRQLR